MSLTFGRWLCSCHPSVDLEQSQDETGGKTTQAVTLEQEISSKISVSVSVSGSRTDDGAKEVDVGLTVRF